jgi:intracellular sulfur oxidation DsrE/DsrF family protein
MNSDDKADVSYDRLNALVDGELDRSEESRVLDAIRQDPDLERQACELRHAKHLVRNAYRDETPLRGKHGRGPPVGWRWLAVAAVSLVTLGASGGWIGHSLQLRGQDGDYSWLAKYRGAVTQAASADRVLLHLSSSAPERVSAMVDEAEGMLRAARQASRAVSIEIVANNTGLDALRLDVTSDAGRLAALQAEYPNLTLVACAQTIERLRERGVQARLLPRATVATSALDQIVKRIHEGWTYVRA